MKKVLVIYYSQSGQLEEISRSISQPFVAHPDVSVDFYEIQPLVPFPFPWNKGNFFEVFPESFAQTPVELVAPPEHILAAKYDLILLHYQVWYLSPSIPVNSFLKSEWAAPMFKNTPVITISGSRNMWIMAQEKIKKLLTDNQAMLVGNIALVDRVGNLISVVTIVEWMFSGEKKRYLNVFPLPGVSENDIRGASVFGSLALESLLQNSYTSLQQNLLKKGAVRIKPFLVLTDRTGNKIFKKWSGFIQNRKKSRKIWLKVFYVYLFLAIWVISPIVYILHALTYPFKINKIKRETLYFQGV